MKELSIEEKAKAYDETIEKLRDFYRDYDTVSLLIDVKEELANIFPELKESEDERIRKALIENFKFFGGDRLETSKWGKDDGLLVTDIIAWLEKQREQKPAEWSEEDEKLYKSALWHIKNSCGNGGKNSGEFEVYNWLKSLKDRVLPQNTWKPSNEQLKALDYVCHFYNPPATEKNAWDSLKNIEIMYGQLKKLTEE